MALDAEALSSRMNSLQICGESTNLEECTGDILNPFLISSADLQQPQTFRDLLANLLQPALNKQKDATQILPTHPFFDQVRTFWQKYGWPLQRFENYRRLLCGILNFPCILLLNPKNDHLMFDEMVQKTRILLWLQDTLNEMDLCLDDIIIMDLFPMLTNEWLDQHPDEREEAIREAFDLTIDFIQEFKIRTILSCQCFAPFQHPRWGDFSHTVADGLRSSMIGADNGFVLGLNLTNHTVHGIHGFHPAKIYYEFGKERQRLEELLHGIFTSSFEPCAAWLDRYKMDLQESLDKKRLAVRTTAETLHRMMADYEEERKKADTLGMNFSGPSQYDPTSGPTLRTLCLHLSRYYLSLRLGKRLDKW